MGRPSKLSDSQWAEVAKRLVAGEKAADLAREFGISKTAISVRVSKRAETIQEVAQKIVETERALGQLEVADQLVVVNLASKLRAMSEDLVDAGSMGAKTALKLHAIAHQQISTIDVRAKLTPEAIEVVKSVAAISRTANEASAIGVGLMTNQKKTVEKSIHDELPSVGGGVMAPVFNVTVRGK